MNPGFIDYRIYRGSVVKRLILHFVAFIIVCTSSIVSADIDFDNWKNALRVNAITEGILPDVYDKNLGPIEIDPDIIKLDGSQPEFSRNIWDYLNNATSEARLKKGKILLQTYQLLFNEIEQRYGVQREIITAIWAMESDFGRNYGNKNVVSSLATLAYASSSPRRSEFARDELLTSLKIIQTKKIDAKNLVGSWAGAMGQPQFMPSSYHKYAVDYDNDGRVDLWNSIPDVFASIANFLAESGWRKLEGWGEEVTLPQEFDWRLNSSSYQLRFEQWQELGVRRVDSKPFEFPQRQSALFIPAGKFGPKFLVTHNFDVIKRYNKSSSYALAVANLSNLFADGDKIITSWPTSDIALSHDQVAEIQMKLNLAGHNAGLADGKIGVKTREAIRTWQLEQGYAGDGYANLELLILLRNK